MYTNFERFKNISKDFYGFLDFKISPGIFPDCQDFEGFQRFQEVSGGL